MTVNRRRRVTDLLVDNLVDVIEQWVVNGERDDLAAFLEQELGFDDLSVDELEEQADAYDLFREPPRPDLCGRTWDIGDAELCVVCGQPDSCGDCNHEPLSDSDVAQLCE
jgi:hypothetical protein